MTFAEFQTTHPAAANDIDEAWWREHGEVAIEKLTLAGANPKLLLKACYDIAASIERHRTTEMAWWLRAHAA